MVITRLTSIAILIFLGSSNILFGGYALRWDSPSNVSTGAPINVDLYLEQTESDTAISSFGVAAATYTVNRTGSGTIGSVTPNFVFEGPALPGLTPTATTDGNSAEFVQTQTNILGASNPSGSVLIGSFTINAVAPGTGQLAVDLLNIGNDIGVYVDNMFTVLPLGNLNLTAPTFNYDFTAVPEPSSIGGISAIICLRYWRRRKRIVGEREASRWQKWRLSERRRKKATTPQYCRETGVWS